MKMIKYNPDKHQVDDFVSFGNGWLPRYVAVKAKKVEAVLLEAPKNYPAGSTKAAEKFGSSSWPGKQVMGSVLRVRKNKSTTIIGWPDTVVEAQRKLDAYLQHLDL